MGLSILNSSVGYDTIGLQDLIKDIKIDIIPNVVTSIRNQKNSVRDSINSVWVGSSAEAFKSKLDNDSEVLCNALNNLTGAIEANINVVGSNVEEIDAEISKMFGGTGSSGGTTFSSYVNNLADLRIAANSSTSNTSTNILDAAGNVLNRTGATIATVGFGLVEGVETFGEAILDTGAILGTGVASIFTGAYDLFTGSDSTKQMWEGTKGFVQKKLVKDMADDFYKNTGVGQWVSNNAYGFNLTRNISSGVGYVGGVVALTVATFGVGGAAVGGTAAGTSAATSVSISAGQLAATAGVAGFGRGTQDAWADGADIGEGLVYGAASGTWEAAQFYVGGRMANFQALNSAGANVAARIGFDTVDGAVEGFVQPGLQMLYRDESYGELFNANGGMAAVGQNALVGTLSSAIGERAAIRDILNDRVIVGSAQAPTSTKIYAETAAGNTVKNDLLQSMGTTASNSSRINELYANTLANQVNGNNKDALAFANTMTKLANEGKLRTSELTQVGTTHSAYYAYDGSGICLGSFAMDNGHASTLTHEAGHAVFDLVSGSKVPDGYDSIVANARDNALKDSQFHKITDNVLQTSNNSELWKQSQRTVNDNIIKTYNQNPGDYFNGIASSVDNQIKNGTFDPAAELRKYGVNDDTIQALGTMNGKDYANALYRQMCNDQVERTVRTQYGNTTAFSDICDAVFEGGLQSNKVKDAFGNQLHVSYGHGEKYFSGSTNNQFHEMIANYNQLKLNNGYSQIQQLKSVFGKDFVNMLETEWQKLANY